MGDDRPFWDIHQTSGQFLGYTTSMGDIGKAMGAMTVIAGYPIDQYINIKSHK
ncbi:MAG: hypothetical oligosaccharyl transferase [Metallosphaera javensis (ex Sakai et al. 2022)]|nr:MAG: hypothetical oligosaccharyl transferase [Metallosphaera javensis (ex Sakai et al. 2022)]